MATQTVDLGPVIGPQGPKGDTGPGVPTGGAAGQILVKVDATNFNTVWKSLIDAGIFKADGSVPATGHFYMNNHSISGVQWLNFAPEGGGIMEDDEGMFLSPSSGNVVIHGTLNMDGHQINNVADPTTAYEAVNVHFLQNNFVQKSTQGLKIYGTLASGEADTYTLAQGTAAVNSIPQRTAGGQIFVTAPSSDGHATNRLYVKDRVKVLSPVVVPGSTWSSGSGQDDFPYYYDIAITGVGSTDTVLVGFNVDDAMSGNFSPTAYTDIGKVRIYGKQATPGELTLGYIMIFRRSDN